MLNNRRTMREQDNFRTPCDPPRRPQRKWIAPALGSLILAAGLAMNSPTARAQITYTWHEDDTKYMIGSQNVTGSLVVSNAALNNFDNFGNGPEITTSNITKFTFTIPDVQTFTQDNGSFDSRQTIIYISSQDASPNGGGTGIVWQDVPEGQVPSAELQLALDTHWSATGGEYWVYTSRGGQSSGYGHWSIDVASVPEPSCAVQALIVAVSGLTYGMCRYRWIRRHKPVDQTDATQ